MRFISKGYKISMYKNITFFIQLYYSHCYIQDACILYSSTGEKAYFPETVSGPRKG